MREEMRKYGVEEGRELPDHITHVLSIIGSMANDEATKFVTACVLPAVKKMLAGFDGLENPYGDVVTCLVLILHHVWGEGESFSDGSESEHPDGNVIPEGVDLLHTFPVADFQRGGCGNGGCGSSEPKDLVQLGLNVPSERSES